MTDRRLGRESRTLLPWARLYAVAFRTASRHLARMSRDDLRALMRGCENASEANCDWRTYQTAQLLYPVIVQELHLRTRVPDRPTKGKQS